MQKNAPLEIERKFLIEYPDTALLDYLSEGNCSYISQTYLWGRTGERARTCADARWEDGLYA